jgi:histidinol dehydrogenase
MLKQYTPEEAQETLLKRQALDDMPVSARILDSIEALFGEPLSPEAAVKKIIDEVRLEGDNALQKWSRLLDGLDAREFRVQQETIQGSLTQVSQEIINALELARLRIRNFYENQPVNSWIIQNEDGTLGQLVRPIARVGLYIPGGTAPLPSTLLMSAVPAQIAGVKEIVIVVPPEKGTGAVAPVTLAAAALLGIDEVYTLGGAQAIAALAYGTDHIPAVDKIFGPGNLFVTLAKRRVFGTVGIDGLAGPTETMIIADDSAKPEWVAADLLAQAEHDVLASAILLTPSSELAKNVQEAVDKQLPSLPRAEILAESLSDRSGIVLTKDLSEAVDLANKYAPEHLCLSVRDAMKMSERIHSAGGIFVGDYSCEVLGDYVAGPSHVMPTSGTARFASPLNLWDFVHIVSLVALGGEAAAELSGPAAQIARSEGLEAHARAADFRSFGVRKIGIN